MTTQTIADAADRAAALDPRASCIVQAPAGSGKTELLTQRVLVLLAGVDEPEEIVAITFTRKAAAEMRARVFRAIADAATAASGGRPAPPSRTAGEEGTIGEADGGVRAAGHDVKAQTRRLALAVLQRSRERGWGLEENPQRLRVMTIDALCMQISQQMPVTAGFGGRVQIADQPQELYREAARATLDALETDSDHREAIARVLRHFDNRSGLLEQQLMGLLARRDQWLRFVTASGRAAREELEAALQQAITEALQVLEQCLPADGRDIWLASAAHASSQRYESAPDWAVHRLRDGQWPDTQADALPRWLALAELVLTADGEWRKRLDKNLGFPAPKTKAEAEALGAPRDAHQQLIARLKDAPGLLAALQALRQLPAPRYDDAQWQVLQALLDVMRLAAAQLHVVFAMRGEVDFTEVAARAVLALGDEEAPTELGLALDYRIRHLLVDEFQDTSQTQIALLRRLTAGWQPGDGRTLFVVGDPMQSIYRFREADVGLFLDARRRGIGALQLDALALRCNFRSDAGIVDWVNTAFAQVLPPQENIGRGAVPYNQAVATRQAAEAPAVLVHPRFDNDARAEAAQVVALVAAARREDPQGSIAVLVRSRTHLDELMPALRGAGLKYRAVDLESLASRPVIEDLRALTRALLHPLDRVAWLALLRAPYCGLQLGDLLALSGGLGADTPLLLALRDPQRLDRLQGPARARLVRVLEIIEATLAQQGRKPLRRWVESAWYALGGPAALREPRDLGDAQQFFAALEELAPGATLDDLDGLDLHLRELRATPDPLADGSLSLMTIHKSKGLEFDTVIVPGLGRTTRSDTPPPVMFSRAAAAFLLAPVQPRGDESDSSYRYLRALEADKQVFEDGRLLYVAATRARRRLHLIGHVGLGDDGAPKAPPPSSLLARLWPALAAAFRDAAAGVPPATQGDAPLNGERPAPPLLRRLRADWRTPPRMAGLPAVEAPTTRGAGKAPAFDWAGEVARIVGVVFHRWAQRLAAEPLERWSPARRRALHEQLPRELQAQGVPLARSAAAAALVEQGIASLLDEERGRWLFDPAHRQARSEWALTAVLDGVAQRYVIDRSFIDAEGTRWVVDFKTSRHQGGDLAAFIAAERERYAPQLQSYAAILRRYGDEPVRTALYLPLLDVPGLRWQPL